MVGLGRSRGFEALLQDPRDGDVRGFLFELSVVLTAPVDPLSGMTVNLMDVDSWLNVVIKELSFTTWKSRADLLSAARQKMQGQMRSRPDAFLQRLELHRDSEILQLSGDGFWTLRRREVVWQSDENAVNRESWWDVALHFPEGREDEARRLLKESFSQKPTLPSGFHWGEKRHGRGRDEVVFIAPFNAEP